MTHVHFIGIGGSGLSAIARLLNESGYIVTGSDRTISPFAADLQAAGLTIYIGHHPRNVQGADWVVRSSAIPDDNPEVTAAQQAGIPVYKRADFLGKLMENKTGIAVAGTHGKTTTTAMLAFVLSELGRNPSFIVGGVMNNYGVNARAGKGKAFVIEADEYDRMFLGLKPRIEVVTNLEHDHPDCYPTFEDMVTAFESFVSLLPNDGTLIACVEDAGAASLLSRARRIGRNVIAYSMQGEMTINAPQWVQARMAKPNERGGFDFDATTNVGTLASTRVSLQVPGEHNVRNALAVLSVIASLGLSFKDAAAALRKFTGTGRRFEVKGEKRGVTVIDDYAHHPTEIKATLAAARARYPNHRILAVWQPHTYSRTQALFHEFSRAFNDADEVIVTEVYPAREPKQEFSSAEVVSAMPHSSARFISSLEETAKYLLKHLKYNDILLVLSAGDADQVSANVLAGLT
ncbi:MAG: UDP-N-acetylmuramate--L-alanine ligase [Chloroflexi bacterium]|nr:UDP-N-acetylmuramate--L-alanine ligase [Chloroflexota bacterium]MBI1855630.1 UDP-N-acetylmuramate--L-alanine ligase [Chloroflexota bacterium]MBI3341188.1 UDP-N-acetylmuramate--L-alanine ligase [Chloroflexota bacterium]